jgi:AbrB family looped-hinge helix DNA binding protein
MALESILDTSYCLPIDMETVTVSPKFQVVIPLSIRKELGLQPGMKLHVFRREESVEFIPLKSMKGMRGFLRGMDTSLQREDDRL